MINKHKTHFVVDRSKWRCGGNKKLGHPFSHGEGITSLKNKEGYMCCLGFVSNQLGFTEEDILGRVSPCTLSIECSLVPSWFLRKGYSTNSIVDTLSFDAIDINDNPDYTDSEREVELIRLFNKYGLTLEFVGEYE